MSVLMVSPTPTHPQDAGNRARIFRLAEELRSLGADPFFLYYGTEPADLGAMRAFWGERLRVVPAKAGPTPPRGRWNALSARLGKRPAPGPVDVDAWCSPDLEEAAVRLHAAHRFRVIWVEYVFLSEGPVPVRRLRAQGHRCQRRLFRTVRDDKTGSHGPGMVLYDPGDGKERAGPGQQGRRDPGKGRLYFPGHGPAPCRDDRTFPPGPSGARRSFPGTGSCSSPPTIPAT